tara:strand:+ start:1039 stop:1878 length:840 start_codon:yes stop_codon:yes gene_type:complete
MLINTADAEDDNTTEDEPVETEVAEQIEPGDEAEVQDPAAPVEAEEDEEVEITLSGETPSQDQDDKKAPQWVRDLRKTNRELQREKRELEERLKAKAVETNPTVEAKPTLESVDYDSDRFERELESWHERKRAADAEQKAWSDRLATYGKAKASLRVPDFDAAESVALTALNTAQQGLLLQATDNPAAIIYALGKNPKKASELAELKDPVKFVAAIAKLEATQLQIKKKTAPAPERTLTGTTKTTGNSESALDRLRAEAEKTGDYSKLHRYKMQQRSKQ